MAERKKLKVYLESSFVSYLTGRETDDAKIAADQAHTRRWMREQAPLCDVVVSQYVVEESLRGREDLVKRRMEFLANQELIKFDAKTVSSLAAKLIAAHALPPKETTDALHIAAASVSGADYLLTWNCCHMANPHTLPKTIQIIEKAGFRCPQIMTPLTFLENLTLGKRK